MNVAVRRTMTLDQFLAWEERQPLRYEFDGLKPVAMTGGTRAHAAIQANLITTLRSRLRGQACQAFGSELKVIVSGRIRYPDALITCTPGRSWATIASEPVIVFEILSEGTMHADLSTKNEEYRGTASIQRYVILHQTSPGALVFWRKASDWVAEPLGAEGVIQIPEASISVPVSELYIDVVLEAPPGDDPNPSPSVR